MTIIKTILIASILLYLSSLATAQKITIKGGFNLSTIHYQNKSPEIKQNPGFHFGYIAEFPITELFSIETGLLFSNKGFCRDYGQITIDGVTGNVKETSNLNYLDIPLSVKVSFKIAKSKLFISAGPYAGIGLYGKLKQKSTFPGALDYNEKVIWGNDNFSMYKRFDFGFYACSGIQFNSFQLGLNFNYGLRNIVGSKLNSFEFGNEVIAISFGYNLHKK